MPTPIADQEIDIRKASVVWPMPRRMRNRASTGSIFLFYQGEFFHSNSLKNTECQNIKTNQDTYHYVNNRSFDKIYEELEPAYIRYEKIFENISFEDVQIAINDVMPSLEDFALNSVKVELTPEKSLFYSLKSESLSLYVQQFLEDDEDDEVKATLTVFENNEKKPGYAGSIEYVLNNIQRIIPSESLSSYNFEFLEIADN